MRFIINKTIDYNIIAEIINLSMIIPTRNFPLTEHEYLENKLKQLESFDVVFDSITNRVYGYEAHNTVILECRSLIYAASEHFSVTTMWCFRLVDPIIIGKKQIEYIYITA